MLRHSQLHLNSATELVVVLQQMVSQAQFWNFPVFIYLFSSRDHTAAAGHSGGMLAKHTLQKASVTSGDGISSAFINFCIIFSKDAFLLMLEDY